MPWCPKCGSEYKEGIARCRTCDRDLVSEPREPVADAEGAPDTGIAPLPEAMVGAMIGWMAPRAADLWRGARLFLLALVRIPRAGRLVGLLAILALLQVPSSRSGAGVYFSWFWPPLEGPRLAALGDHFASRWGRESVPTFPQRLVSSVMDPLRPLTMGITMPAMVAFNTMADAYANGPDKRTYRSRLAFLWLYILLAAISAAVAGGVYGWLHACAAGKRLSLRSLVNSVRSSFAALFGLFSLLLLAGYGVGALATIIAGDSAGSQLPEIASGVWYILRTPLALVPFVIVAFRLGLWRGVVRGLQVMRAEWRSALGAWIAYLAALEVFELVGWLVLGGAASAALQNLQFGRWIPIAALAVVSTFLTGWLALAICGAFMEIVLRSQNQASAADPINEPLAATAGS
jgi:hypothetical protein